MFITRKEINMKKIVKIGNTEYSMKSSAYTQFKYKNDTGRKMLEDIQKLSSLENADQEQIMNGLDDVLELVLKIAYIMIEEADSNQVTTYEDFLKGLDGLLDNQDWIQDVILLATAPISRGIQKNSQEIN
jgi:hypothetical protein